MVDNSGAGEAVKVCDGVGTACRVCEGVIVTLSFCVGAPVGCCEGVLSPDVFSYASASDAEIGAGGLILPAIRSSSIKPPTFRMWTTNIPIKAIVKAR